MSRRWLTVQHELIPHLGDDSGQLPPRLEKLIHVLEWIRIEEWTDVSWCGRFRKAQRCLKTTVKFGRFLCTLPSLA
jgi:hypothetical protein